MSNNNYCEGCNCGKTSSPCAKNDNVQYYLVDTRPPQRYNVGVVPSGFYQGLPVDYAIQLGYRPQ